MRGSSDTGMDGMIAGHQTLGVSSTTEKMLSIAFAKCKCLEKFSDLYKR
jgi:hypothetical protein